MLKLMKILVSTNLSWLIFLMPLFLSAQEDFIFDTVKVDAISIDVKKGFQPEDFIRMTKEDTSFLKAFKNLKFFPHQSNNDVIIFDKKWTQIASLKRTAQHNSNGELGWISDVKEKTDGRVYKRNGKHKYFTAEMFDKVFFPEGKFVVDNRVDSSYQQEKPDSWNKKDKYYEKLKTFMFSPGTGVDGVPLIGKKLNIFDEKMAKWYDFKVEQTFFHDTVPCYKFSVVPKATTPDRKISITKLVTFYDRRTMNIIARSYNLKDNTALFSFDIKMYIELKYDFNEYLPIVIKYNGEWDVPLAKPEKIKFKMICSDYKAVN